MSESSLTPTGSQNNQRLALVAVIGVAVVGVIVYLLLFSGKSSSSGPAASVTPHVVASAPASASPSAVEAVPAAYTAAVGRNPFQPALTPPAAPAAAATTAGATKAPTPTPTPTPTQPLIVIPTLTLAPSPTVTVTASPSPTATVTVTPSPTGLPTAGNSITLALVRADSSGTVDVTVTNGATTTPYNNVAPGQVFGTYFKLVSILSDTSTSPTTYGADFEYGDQFVQLAKGQSATLG
jgi:type IV secretory pathway VirB10-like protein